MPNLTIPREDRFFALGLSASVLPANPLIFQFDGDAYHEVYALGFASGQPGGLNAVNGALSQAIDNYTINFRELGSAAQSFVNVPIMPSLIGMQATNAKHFRTPWVLAPNSMIQVDVAATPANVLGTNEVFDMTLWTVKRYQMSAEEYARRRQRPYFTYATPIFGAGSAFAALPQSFIIQIATDADFVVQNIVSYGDFQDAGGIQSAPSFAMTVDVTDMSSDKKISSIPVPWHALTAQGTLFRGCNRLQSPLIFRRNTPIKVDVAGNIGAAPFNFQLGFEGYKIKD